MKPAWIVSVLAIPVILLVVASSASARPDAIWARSADNFSTINLDGVLDEGAWALAESMHVEYPVDAGIPGSGWKSEGGVTPSNPTRATLKFLVRGNQLYMGAIVHDTSVGGSASFNRFDGFLMSLKDHSSPNHPKPPAEYTYAWWYPTLVDPQPPGQPPAFIGRWAEWPPGSPRTVEQIANWDARTIVHGLSNSDATLDTDWTTEMRFNLTPMGYDTQTIAGDIIEFNISIYDCDWFWPLDPIRFSSNRVWWQGPWANAAWYNEVRVHASSVVGMHSALPEIEPEYLIGNGAAEGTPVIDGSPGDAVWAKVPGFEIRFGDDDLRETYGGIGPYRAGQFQPEVNGGLAPVLDPGDATVKMFFKGTMLYMAFDVRDQVVQYHPSFDRWDGFLVSLNERNEQGPDHNLLGRRLSFQVGEAGAAVPHDYLQTLVEAGKAQVAVALRSGTTVDTLGIEPDNGYAAELAVDLTEFGYPADLGDGALFIGVDLLDGDSFIPYTDSYGTRTWWYREYENECCPVWAYMDPDLPVAGAQDDAWDTVAWDLLDARPNPFTDRTTFSYSLPSRSSVVMEVFDPQGRRVERRDLGTLSPGEHQVSIEGKGRSAGVYLVRMTMTDPDEGAVLGRIAGRLVQLK
ncbi:MAG: hypothetical protein ACE15D_17490 [Candidatus Eisenbacteria bacterium]|nr:hypothetical protein [Candidatus Eisenbacteria bacterium]